MLFLVVDRERWFLPRTVVCYTRWLTNDSKRAARTLFVFTPMLMEAEGLNVLTGFTKRFRNPSEYL